MNFLSRFFRSRNSDHSAEKAPQLDLTEAQRAQLLGYFHRDYDPDEKYDVSDLKAFAIDRSKIHLDQSDLEFIQKSLESEGLTIPALRPESLISMDDPWNAEVLTATFKSHDDEEMELIYSISYSSGFGVLATATVVPVEWELTVWPKIRKKALEFFLQGNDKYFSPQAEKVLMENYCISNKIGRYRFWFESFFSGDKDEKETRVSGFFFASLL